MRAWNARITKSVTTRAWSCSRRTTMSGGMLCLWAAADSAVDGTVDWQTTRCGLVGAWLWASLQVEGPGEPRAKTTLGENKRTPDRSTGRNRPEDAEARTEHTTCRNGQQQGRPANKKLCAGSPPVAASGQAGTRRPLEAFQWQSRPRRTECAANSRCERHRGYST